MWLCHLEFCSREDTDGEDKYDLKDEELRPYFALPAVLNGLFKVGRSL
jgi:Zn-dependent oligopeptidase